MIRLLFAVLAMIVGALVAGAYFQFDPTGLIFAALAFGIYMVGCIGGPSLPADGGQMHWGGGEGIYFSGHDVWVEGAQSRDRDPNGDPPKG
jgi:hypothetical protein